MDDACPIGLGLAEQSEVWSKKQFGKMMVIKRLENKLLLARSPNRQFERCLVHNNARA
jgi:hypothetical protein